LKNNASLKRNATGLLCFNLLLKSLPDRLLLTKTLKQRRPLSLV